MIIDLGHIIELGVVVILKPIVAYEHYIYIQQNIALYILQLLLDSRFSEQLTNLGTLTGENKFINTKIYVSSSLKNTIL